MKKSWGKVLGKILGRMGLVFLGLLGIILFVLFILFVKYRQWEKDESEFLSTIVSQKYSDKQKEELNKKLEEFQKSEVEKESIRLTRNDFEILFWDSITENDVNTDLEGVEIVTLNRSFDLYVKCKKYPWVIVRMWQRQEGSIDFVVYDIKVGPISLSTFSWGWVNSEFSKGVQDAIDLVLSENFSGRKVEEIYVFDNGIRFVGVMGR